MMRKLLGIVAVLSLVALQSHAADEKKADKTDKDKLQGAWTLSSVEIGGQALPVPEGEVTTFIFDGDKLKIKDKKTDQEGSYKMDDSKKPKEIDITTPKKDNPKEMETLKGIYSLDGDTFKVAISPGKADARPTAFDGKETFVLIFKRKK